MLKVATFNVKNKSADKLLRGRNVYMKGILNNTELIFKSSPDIIGLQEVTKDEYYWLKKYFGGTYDIYGDFRGSIGISDEACPIMIKKNKGKVIFSKTFYISDDIFKTKSKFNGAVFPRIATYVNFSDNIDNYGILNIHASNLKNIQRKTFSENGPIEKILNLFYNDKQIIMGDMNTDISGDLREFCLRNSLLDAALPLGNTYKPLNLALDHILYRDSDLSVDEVKTYKNTGSDHQLILANMIRRKNI